MDTTQTKIIGLTMELNLKVKEYKMLCKKIYLLKRKNINPNDERLVWVKDMLLKNYNEISEINKKLTKLEKK